MSVSSTSIHTPDRRYYDNHKYSPHAPAGLQKANSQHHNEIYRPGYGTPLHSYQQSYSTSSLPYLNQQKKFHSNSTTPEKFANNQQIRYETHNSGSKIQSYKGYQPPHHIHTVSDQSNSATCSNGTFAKIPTKPSRVVANGFEKSPSIDDKKLFTMVSVSAARIQEENENTRKSMPPVFVYFQKIYRLKLSSSIIELRSSAFARRGTKSRCKNRWTTSNSWQTTQDSFNCLDFGKLVINF